MNTLQGWVDGLDPMIAFLVMGGMFLIACVVGWYVGDLILWIRGKAFP